MQDIVCISCGATFRGRSNKRYCSTRCRRILENKRRSWDSRFKYVRYLTALSKGEHISPNERESLLDRAEQIRGNIRRRFGERP